MSRIGKLPISIPKGVKITKQDNTVIVEGPKGKLSERIRPEIQVEISDDTLVVKRPSDIKYHRALHGLSRALIANMVTGVTEGFKRNLEIIGVGYRAEKAGKGVTFYLGYSHPITLIPPDEITIELEGANKITVSGINKQIVGQIASEIRSFRPPEPYKGKGVKYADEQIRRKAGKTAGA
ncbi:MAG: 50S ribosomal protein L6 [candidate division Zixibacteria bacterium]|nr:50S ribosomal protein L6 [candidate division Zixibacteria bacterium]